MTLGIIVHGGAKTISDDKAKANTAGCLAAVEAGWTVLTSGGSAKDAVEVAIRVLEDNPTFNASIGATLNSEGEVLLDAAMMEGTTLHWGAVAAVQGVRHPISVARKILEDKPLLLVGRGAERFAAEHGDEMCTPTDLISEEQGQHWEEQADNNLGACSTTGDGESIIPVVLAKTAIDLLAGDRPPEEAAQMAIDILASRVPERLGASS